MVAFCKLRYPKAGHRAVLDDQLNRYAQRRRKGWDVETRQSHLGVWVCGCVCVEACSVCNDWVGVDFNEPRVKISFRAFSASVFCLQRLDG